MNLAPCLFVFCLRFELKVLYFVSKFWAICVYVLVLIVLGIDLVIHDNQTDVMLLFEFVKTCWFKNLNCLKIKESFILILWENKRKKPNWFQLFQKSWIMNHFHERIDDRYKADYVIFQKIQNPWFFN